jgi:hypothetical protein
LWRWLFQKLNFIQDVIKMYPFLGSNIVGLMVSIYAHLSRCCWEKNQSSLCKALQLASLGCEDISPPMVSFADGTRTGRFGA